jgi:hypothetical protein
LKAKEKSHYEITVDGNFGKDIKTTYLGTRKLDLSTFLKLVTSGYLLKGKYGKPKRQETKLTNTRL